MKTEIILAVAKAKLGLTEGVRDAYLNRIIQGLVLEMKNSYGLKLSGTRMDHVLFLADFTVWRYQSRDGGGAMPQDLRLRLNNLMAKEGRQNDLRS